MGELTCEATIDADATRRGVTRLFDAIESRRLVAIEDALDPDATWQNVPHRAALGRHEVVALLSPIVRWSDRIRWEIVSSSVEPGVARVERVDRFVIGGAEHSVACHGVFGVNPAGLVSWVRDYCDLTEWRQRIAPVYEAMGDRSASAVVERHIRAVGRRDAPAMSADYSLDAVLQRPGTEYRGFRAIAEYFDAVVGGIGERAVEFEAPGVGDDGSVSVRWNVTGIDSTTSGTDTYVVHDGWITRQAVRLDDGDFW